MQLSAESGRSEDVAPASVHEDACFQLKAGRSGVLLKLCRNNPRRACLVGGSGGSKRPRGCCQPGGVVGEASRDVAASVLCGLLEVSTRPFQGVELRHAELTATHLAPEPKDACRQLGEKNEGSITLSDVFYLNKYAGLHTLDLECNCLGDDGITRLCLWCLPQLRFLKCLFVASNGFGVPGLRAIVSYLEGDVAAMRAPTSFAPVSVSITPKPQPLEAVGLTNNPFYSNNDEDEDEDATVLLGRLLKACGLSLRRLHLNHVGMSASAAATMMQLCFAGGTGRAEGFLHPQLVIYLKQNGICKERLSSTLRDLGVGAAAGNFVV
ncbi:hypothetical protein TraAM80_00507 [Trypanosoma rangeli]|uniref:Uncharacterized protein n=1 Tax=Trypanosoma rangeli TaxID=5698 RepID=A0A3S5ISL8_TRYRA|nr:uncharacterized protein TraAM80_00507 [Trypanosoma rangeli]RNF12090.1 hypothetical protein TraAM80_00507 [Trypanosoma rangeli]|eukprot:RNF12090.1 hypothetical protein TraAM80_00507 [Trypanosoma rangeli]